MPRRRLRTITLWTGTLLCVLIAAAFVVSGRLSLPKTPSALCHKDLRTSMIQPRRAVIHPTEPELTGQEGNRWGCQKFRNRHPSLAPIILMIGSQSGHTPIRPVAA